MWHIITSKKYSTKFIVELSDNNIDEICKAVNLMWDINLPKTNVNWHYTSFATLEECEEYALGQDKALQYYGRPSVVEGGYKALSANIKRIAATRISQDKTNLAVLKATECGEDFYWVGFKAEDTDTVFAIELAKEKQAPGTASSFELAKTIANLYWGINTDETAVIDGTSKPRYKMYWFKTFKSLAETVGYDPAVFQDRKSVTVGLAGYYVRASSWQITMNQPVWYCWNKTIDNNICNFWLEVKKDTSESKDYIYAQAKEIAQKLWDVELDNNAIIFDSFEKACLETKTNVNYIYKNTFPYESDRDYCNYSATIPRQEDRLKYLEKEKYNLYWHYYKCGDNRFIIQRPGDETPRQVSKIAQTWWQLHNIGKIITKRMKLSDICESYGFKEKEFAGTNLVSDRNKNYIASAELQNNCSPNAYWICLRFNDFPFIIETPFPLNSLDLDSTLSLANDYWNISLTSSMIVSESPSLKGITDYLKISIAFLNKSIEEYGSVRPFDSTSYNKYYLVSKEQLKNFKESQIDERGPTCWVVFKCEGRHFIFQSESDVLISTVIDRANKHWGIALVEGDPWDVKFKLSILLNKYNIKIEDCVATYPFDKTSNGKYFIASQIQQQAKQKLEGENQVNTPVPAVPAGTAKTAVESNEEIPIAIEESIEATKTLQASTTYCQYCREDVAPSDLVIKGAIGTVDNDNPYFFVSNDDYSFHKLCFYKYIDEKTGDNYITEVNKNNQKKLEDSVTKELDKIIAPLLETARLGIKVPELVASDDKIKQLEIENVSNTDKIKTLSVDNQILINANASTIKILDEKESEIDALKAKLIEAEKIISELSAKESNLTKNLNTEKEALKIARSYHNELKLEYKELRQDFENKHLALTIEIDKNKNLIDEKTTLTNAKAIEAERAVVLKKELDAIKALPPPGLKCTCGKLAPYNQSNTDNGMYICKTCKGK